MKSEGLDRLVQERETEIAPATNPHLLDWPIIVSKRRRFILGFTLGPGILAIITVFISVAVANMLLPATEADLSQH